MEEQKNFGAHLTIDGYKGDKAKLNDFALVFKSLDELPEKLGMHKIITPYCVIAPPITEKDQGGISGFVMIAESHISIHTFPHKGFVSADIYTCQGDLDTEKISGYFKATFGLAELEINKIKRGERFSEQ